MAAGALIVREAGGVVTDWSGDDEAWLRTGNILAGPPAVHAALLEICLIRALSVPMVENQLTLAADHDRMACRCSAHKKAATK